MIVKKFPRAVFVGAFSRILFCTINKNSQIPKSFAIVYNFGRLRERHSRKQQALVRDHFFQFPGWSLTRASTVDLSGALNGVAMFEIASCPRKWGNLKQCIFINVCRE